MHLALAKDLTPYRAAAHVTGSIARPGLAALNDMITGEAALNEIGRAKRRLILEIHVGRIARQLFSL
jgi:hypothetical protein